MKVLYFSQGLTSPIPGPQSVGRNIINHLTSITDEIEFFLITDKRKSNEFEGRLYCYLNEILPNPEFPVISFELENFLSSRTLKAFCDALKPDLVHIHGYAGYYPSPPKSYRSLITFHDFPPMIVYDDFSFGLSKFLSYLWFKRGQIIRMKKIHEYDYFHALSSEIVQFLRRSGIPSSRVVLIPNGTTKAPRLVNKKYFHDAIRERLRLSSDSKILTMVGSITYRKGVHLIKKCLSELPPNYHLVLLGKPARLVGYQYLRSIMRGKNSHRIHYLGYQSSDIVNAILNASDCFLSLSLSEACQLSPLEAVFVGLPVLITDCGAAKDIFGADYDLLLPVSPDTELLRDKIIEAVENNSKYQNIKTKSKTWREVAILMKDLYFNIVTGTQSQG